ncbi:hypothetical protein AKJ48_03060 [candidate division MSBL1 archaeon SCGC-AAA261O19]|uniref:Nitroreductase domain-containing protein n=1 Tax=candidate division MSBL1 archaeon SCGC-AAA261O19 TaxID=1698277 RepID=A0A133VCZ2_9EURY|nr:hypothetical protein AKJ48_03060 [candidate division MSBL1 archaeon SCGC-AAA261O19]
MIDSIKRRRSVRRFEDREVEEEKINEILEAAMFSPSAHAKYPWEIIVVTDKGKRDALSKTTVWSSFASEAPVCFVVLGDEEESERWIEDGSIVSEHIWLESVNQGLGGCWIQVRGGTTDDPEKDPEEYVRRILEIPEKWRVLSILAVGYPATEKSPHKKSNLEYEKIHSEKYGNTYSK